MMVHEFCKKEGYCVKYIFQFARITAFCLAGEVLAAVLPLPIPASVYGLLLLVAALKFGVLKLDQVRETGRAGPRVSGSTARPARRCSIPF